MRPPQEGCLGYTAEPERRVSLETLSDKGLIGEDIEGGFGVQKRQFSVRVRGMIDGRRRHAYRVELQNKERSYERT
jgi:hypothetical protein